MSLLEVNSVVSGYGKLHVLHQVSISVNKGEIVAVVGPNGAGKTTLMKTIFRVLPLAQGSISFDGQLDTDRARTEIYERFPVLAQRRRQSAGTLSGGERQMLALAGAMVTNPRFLALDEPTTGLAPSIVNNLIDQIVEYRNSGSSILWVVEENPLLVLPYVDRVFLVQGGAVANEMAADELLGDDSLKELFFGAHGS
jgi:branched-chain amino acid transport system ATP-binding protein